MNRFEFTEDLAPGEFEEFARSAGANVKTHFLGSYGWGEVSKTRGWHPHYTGIRNDGKIVATALILEKPLILGYSYFYIPRGFTMDYSDRELLAYYTEAVRTFGKKRKALFFRTDPDIKLHTVDIEGNVIEGESNEELVAYLGSIGYKARPLNYGFENEQPRFTFRIDISGPMDEIRSRYSKTTLHEIRKSRESGVEVCKGTSSDIPEFVRLTRITEARQDYYSHDYDFYGRFYEILNGRGMADIYLGKVNIAALALKTREELAENEALRDKYEASGSRKARGMLKEIDNRLTALNKKLEDLEGRPQKEVIVSSYLTVRYCDKIWTLYGANDMDYSKFYPNYAVYERMIEDANAEGLRVFDGFGTVGRPDKAGSAYGLYEFKKKWGGELTEFIGEFDYIINKPVYFAYSKLIPVYRSIKEKKILRARQQ